MKCTKYSKQLLAIVALMVFMASCNTYKWQRKRYYKSNKGKNWNDYNSEKTKKDQDKELDKYYKKY